MNTVTSIWVVSIVGASLFFVAGLLASRARAPAQATRRGGASLDAQARRTAELELELELERAASARLAAQVPEPGSFPLDPGGDLATADRTIATLRAQLEEHSGAAERPAQERARAERLHQDATRGAGDRDRLRRELAAMAAERDRLVAEAARADRAHDRLRAESTATTAERDRLRQELAAAEAHVHELTQRSGVLERRLGATEQTLEDQDGLRERLRQAEQRASAAESLPETEAARQELSVEVSVLRRRLEELEQVAEDNGRLRQAAAERDALRDRVAEMATELAALRAQGLTRARPPVVPSSPPQASPRCTEATLQALLNGIAESPGMRCAVLADELGLPIVGIGEYAAPLAAFGGFMDAIAAKTGAFLPMNGLERVQVQDEHGVTVSAFPLAIEQARIALVTLTIDSVPTTQQMTRLLRSAATMVQ